MRAEEEPLNLQTLTVSDRGMMDFDLCGKQIGTALHMLLGYTIRDPSHNTKKQLIGELNRRCQDLHNA